jgi:hypothetical protein
VSGPCAHPIIHRGGGGAGDQSAHKFSLSTFCVLVSSANCSRVCWLRTYRTEFLRQVVPWSTDSTAAAVGQPTLDAFDAVDEVTLDAADNDKRDRLYRIRAAYQEAALS